MEQMADVVAAAGPKAGATEPKDSPGKAEEKQESDESLLVVEELLCMLRAQSHLPAPWRRYVGERKKKFEEFTSRLVWLVDEEYLTIMGKEDVKTKRTDIAYMLLAMRTPIFFDEVKNSKCIAALLVNGSVMLSTSDKKHFWDGKRIPDTTPAGERFFYHFTDGKIVKRTTKEFDEAMKAAKVVMMAYDSPLNDYICKYRHILGGLKWEIQPHQMVEYAERRKVPQPPPPPPPPAPGPPVSQVNKNQAVPPKVPADKNDATAL